MKKVLYLSSYTGGGYLAHCLNYSDREVRVNIHEARAAVIKPEYPVSGYYCIFGFMQRPNESGKYPLMFLCENESHNQTQLMADLIDDAVKMKAHIIYAHREKGDGLGVEGFYRDLWQRIHNQGLKIEMRPAPSVGDNEYGSALINEWTRDKAILLPNYALAPTIMEEQVGKSMTTPENIKDPKFYSFHCLRYLIAGIVRDPLFVQSILASVSNDIRMEA